VSLQDCEEFFGWSLELLIQRTEMDPNRFENVLKPLVEGGQKTRIREALLSNIEGEEELKQSVVGATRAGNNIVELFHEELGLGKLDASALAGVVLPAKGKYFSSLSSSCSISLSFFLFFHLSSLFVLILTLSLRV
jgi:hypothetical protein